MSRPKQASCHPDRPLLCKGLCRHCYDQQRKGRGVDRRERTKLKRALNQLPLVVAARKERNNKLSRESAARRRKQEPERYREYGRRYFSKIYSDPVRHEARKARQRESMKALYARRKAEKEGAQ